MSEAAEAFLQGFHSTQPRATARAMSWGRDTQGRSSYQVLRDVLPRDARNPVILDLGCGDGHLLVELAQALPDARLIGVDLCEADLALARAHPALQHASLRPERAQALSCATASVDYVLCHMALMLMGELDRVIAEIARVLRPTGCFAAVLPDESMHTPVFDAFLACFAEVARTDVELRQVALGDPRAFHPEKLSPLFASAAPERMLVLRPFTLRLAGDFERVWSSLSLTYLLPLLSVAGQSELRARFEQRARELTDGSGVIPLELGLQLLEWGPQRR